MAVQRPGAECWLFLERPDGPAEGGTLCGTRVNTPSDNRSTSRRLDCRVVCVGRLG